LEIKQDDLAYKQQQRQISDFTENWEIVTVKVSLKNNDNPNYRQRTDV